MPQNLNPTKRPLLLFFTVAPQGSPYLATPLGEVTKFVVAPVSNWSKVPCTREQQQQNWAPLGIEPGTFQSPGHAMFQLQDCCLGNKLFYTRFNP